MSEPPDEDAGARATPPAGRPSTPFHDDDELASALAAQLLRFAPSGPIPIVRAAEPEPVVEPEPDSSTDRAEPDPSVVGPDATLVADGPETAAPVAGREPRIPPEPEPEPEPVASPVLAEPETMAAQVSAEPELASGRSDAFDTDSESALDQALRLEPGLAELTVDPDTYREWEASLLALAPAERPVPADVVPAPESLAGDDRVTDDPPSPAGTDDATPSEDIAPGDASLPKRQRSTFTPAATSELVPLAPVPLDGTVAQADIVAGAGEGDGQVDTDVAGREDVGAETSTVGVTPSVPPTIPADELVATVVDTGSPAAADAEVVEAELLDTPDGDADVSSDDTAGDTASPAVVDDVVAEEPTPPTPLIGLAATPIRWAEGVDAAGAVRRPTVPFFAPPAPTDETLGDPDPDPDVDDAAGPVVAEPFDGLVVAGPLDLPTPPPTELPPGALITDTGSIRLPVESVLLGSGVEASLDTGSLPIFAAGIQLDRDLDDDIDDVEAPVEILPDEGEEPAVAPVEVSDATGPIVPIVPISTAALIGVPPVLPAVATQEDEGASAAPPPVREPDPRAEDEPRGAGAVIDSLEPTPEDLRIAGVGRQFWMWVAPNVSALTLGLGAVLIGTGVSARQAILSTVVGLVLAVVPLTLTTTAVVRSGQPSSVVSRATFGTVGNVVPTLILLFTRLFWMAMLFWIVATSLQSLVFESGYDLFIRPNLGGLIALGLVAVLSAVVAVRGLGALVTTQLVLTILGTLSVAALMVATAPLVDLATAMRTVDAGASDVIAGAMLVLALLGTAWAGIGGDVARRLRPGTPGAAVAASTGIGAAVPALLLIVWGILLAASNESLSVGLQTDPVATLAQSLPGWYPIPLLLAVTAAVLAGVSAMGYTGGLTLLAAGVPWGRRTATVVVVGLSAVGGVAIQLLVPDVAPLLLDIVPAVAVPVLAWSGLLSAEVLLRRRPLDAQSLLVRGRTYPAARWGNLVALVVITAVGWGLLSPTQGWFEGEGYLWRLFGVATGAGIGGADIGVGVALVAGFLVPLAVGTRAIRRQEHGDHVSRTSGSGARADSGDAG